MDYAIFEDQSAALNAADAIWLAMQPISECSADTNRPSSPYVTTQWAVPWQRLPDMLWVVPINPDVTASGQDTWTIDTFLTSWQPTSF